MAVLVGSYAYFMTGWKRKHQRLQNKLSKLRCEVQEEERFRFAEDLHDDLGTLLTAIRYSISSTCGRSEADQQRLMENCSRLDEAIHQVRGMAGNLRPVFLERSGLEEALYQFVSTLTERFTGRLQLVYEVPTILPSDANLHLYRIVQELLFNAAKFTTRGPVRLLLREKAGQLHIYYKDKGPGFALTQVAGQGIKNLYSRTRLLGGELHLQTQPGGSTEYYITIPINHGSH
jgi:signal transduction histidine kinase